MALGCVIALSGGAALAADQVFIVTSAADNDDGACNAHCTLREAIIAANAAAGHDTIVFNISGNGVHTIVASSSPPIITNPVTIDATTETDYVGVPRVEIDGVNTGGANGLWFSVNSGASLVRGLGVNRWGPGITTQAGVSLTLQDNYIGVSAGDGVTPRPNQTGIAFLGGTNHIVVGNLISGNSQAGLRVQDVTGATIQGNRIGTNAAGTAALANGLNDGFNFFSGLEITPTGLTGASGIVIGGSGAGEGNVISGNARSGIDFYPSQGRTVDDTTIQANLIGTNAAGTAAIGNGWHGVHIRGFGVNGPTTDTTIGGTAAGEGNTIAFNGRDGVAIDTNGDPENLRNSIRGNSIFSNGGFNGLGIDLDANGVTANDAFDIDGSANGLQNFPVLSDATPTSVAGALDSRPDVAYAIDVYSSSSCDPTGNGEGAVLVGSFTVTTDAGGHVDFAEALTGAAGLVSATATDALGNTSEFSACRVVAGSAPQPGPTFTVNTTEDDAPADAGCSTTDCTLREAIDAANGQAGPNTIEFDVAGGGPHTIQPATALPAITEAVFVDGASEPDYAGTPVVEINGAVVSAGPGPWSGLSITGNDSVVRGLVVNRFDRVGAGVGIEILGGDRNAVEGSFIGTDATGAVGRPNWMGIEIRGGAVENTIGRASAARNVISGNNDRGVMIQGALTSLNVVENNYVGLDATGMTALGNGGYGVQIVQAGTNTVSGNIITANASGVLIGGIGVPTSAQVVDGNGIGINVAGTVLGQLGTGVGITDSSGHVVQSNTIAGHTDGGILVFGDTSTGNDFRLNSIKQNEGLGIDLDAAPRGITPNDLNDEDVGENGLQNFPELTSAIDTTIEGSLHSEPDTDYVIDFFSSPACDTSGNGEGATYLSSQTVTTGEGGTMAFTKSLPTALPVGTQVTATATGEDGTSEFSACIAVVPESPAGEEIIVESSPLGSSSPSSWIDPAATASNASLHLINATCLPLLGFDDETGALVPVAATAMPLVSADGKTYTFTVESGHAFSDGEGVTPESFKRAFERATSQAMADSLAPNSPPWRSEVAQIAGADAFFAGGAEISGIDVTATTISITLVAETAGFLRRLLPYMCATSSDAPAGFSTAPLASAGPYYVTTASDTEIVLEQNPNYGGGRVREPGRIRWAPHGSALVEDYVADASPAYVAAADALDVRNPTTTLERFILTTHRPPFNDPNIRRAVAFALNRTELSSESGVLAPTEQLLPPLMPGHERATVYPLDGSGEAAAIALMGAQTPTVDLCYTSGNPPRQALVEAAQRNLEDVGFTVNLQPVSAATLFATLLPAGDTCELGLFALIPSADPGPYLVGQFHSDRIPPGGSNWSFYSNPVLDARMDAAEALRPDAARLTEWGSIDVAITEAAPSVAIGTRFRRDVTADRIGCRYATHAVWGYPVNRLCVQSVDQEADEGTVYVVTTGGDSEAVGPCDASGCNMREAITAANLSVGPDTIVFAIGAGGPQTIQPQTELPAITEAVTIDGTSQPGWTGAPIVELDGTLLSSPNGDGLRIDADDVTIRGLVVNSFDSSPSADGIDIAGTGNLVEGSYIGTDLTGLLARPNHRGIGITGSDNTIGTSTEHGRNVISGNDEMNIRINSETAVSNVVANNYIGPDATGNAGLGGGFGVMIHQSAQENLIGDSEGEPNVISGNGASGVRIDDAETTGNVVDSNYIGVDATGAGPLGNDGSGVEIFRAGGNTIRRNLISANETGVAVATGGASGTASANTIQANSISGNTGLGIDLVGDEDGGSGVTPNDPGDADAGPNGLQNFPVLTYAAAGAGSTTVNGTLNSLEAVGYVIDLYASDACDPSGYGEGATHLGSGSVITSDFGDGSFSVSVDGELTPGTFVTATATEGSGSTSEFSACIQVGTGYTVNANDDVSDVDGCTSAHCSLREAILAANGDGVPSSIGFGMPDNTIEVVPAPSVLPVIRESTVIDGTTQPGGSVVLDGNGVGGPGLQIGFPSSGSTITGFETVGFSDAIGISSSSNNTIVGNSISGAGRGIVVFAAASSNNVIGGSRDAGEGNRIWDAELRGVDVVNAAGTVVAGNTIGLDPDDAGFGGDVGIRVQGATGTVVGHGVGPGGLGLIDYDRANVVVAGRLTPILDERGSGIALAGGSTGTVVAGNFVGTEQTGRTDLGNLNHGIRVHGASNNNQLGPGNVVAHNGTNGTGDGISVESSSGNRIVANSIRDNGDRGIALSDANPSAPTPLLDAATRFGGQTRLDVFVEAEPGPTYFMELFMNSSCAPAGEGESYFDFRTVTPDANGEVTAYIGPLAPGTLLTVTLTNVATNETSEFSNCFAVLDGGNVQGGPTFTVNTGPDDLTPDDEGCTFAECTLREAIVAANAVGGPNTIAFAFDGTQIGLNAPLPEINRPVVIDGTTQVGGVQINGSDAAGDGFVLGPGSSGSTIQGLEFRFFAVTGEAAIRILSSGNTVRGNSIRDVDDGIVMSGPGATNNVVGGFHDAGQGNAIWAFTNRGVGIVGAGTGNRVSGNTIGVDPDTVADAGTIGVGVSATSGTVIGADIGPGGSPNTDLGNVVAGASGDGGVGILVGGGSTGTRVTSNFVGVHRFPSEGLGNLDGILVDDSTKNRIGPGNTVSQNGGAGVEVAGEGAVGNRITRNSIFDNGGQGINLAGGGNNGIAAPSLFSATEDADSTTIEGEHNGTPGRDYVVEIFSNSTCDGSGSGEGETFLVNVTYTATEEFQDFSTVIEGVFPGDVITATVTDVTDAPQDMVMNPADDTSEFSNCVSLSDEGPPPAPILFGAVVDATPGTLGVAGLVDTGQPLAGVAFDVQFVSTNAACDPSGPKVPLGTGSGFVTNETGVAGFAKEGLTNVPVGTYVAAIASRGGLDSAMSNCVIADRNNTSWHTAHELAADDSETGHLRESGQGRWFKVPILPSSRVDIQLSGLPADYDLIVFSDIQASYDAIMGGADPHVGPNLAIDDLNRQGAEAPSDVFNTSQFNPSSWDPTNWDAGLNTAVFSASQWSPSQWSPSQWSASQWSASQWSPSQWSPSQWSPSQWSASQWSPSQWSPSQWSPSQWSTSNPADPKTFADAQTRSLLAVSAGSGTGDEAVSVNTWNNTGHFYIRVQGKNGSFDADSPFTVEVSREGNLCSGVADVVSSVPAVPDTGRKTVILVDDSRMTVGSTLSQRLVQFAARPEVAGAIVDVSSFPAVNTLNTQADTRTGCPYAKNLVASKIKQIVDSYRVANPLEYVVVIGDDNVIPFFRYPDPALLGNESLYTPPVRDDTASQASLRLGNVLSDDFLASSKSISLHGNAFPVPDLASGRLVETPAEVLGMLDAYLAAQGEVVPGSSLVTGYDFLQDAADAVAEQLHEGIGTGTHHMLVTDQSVSPATTTVGTTPSRSTSWTGDDLRRSLFQSGRHDMIFLSGHFSANDALGADYRTNVLSTELAASTTNFENSIVFSAGCHAGYNIVNGHATPWTEQLDWVQAFAQKRATLIAGTGYQYGDTDFLAHSERIYAEFARQLRVSPTGERVPVAVGSALLRSKQRFLETTPGLSALDEKAVLQATLFGLPMLSVNMPQGRLTDAEAPSEVTETQEAEAGTAGADLGLRVASVDFGSTLTSNDLQLRIRGTNQDLVDGPLATYLSGPDGVAVRPTQPILPLHSLNVTPPETGTPIALRGVALRRATYTDTTGTTPLTAAPATELRGVHAPFFSDVFFPTQPWTPNFFGALAPGDGGTTSLHVTPVQHRSESPTMTRREFDDLDFQLFYSGNVASYCPGTVPLRIATPANPCVGSAVTPALSAPPTVTGVETFFDEETDALTVNARVVGDPVAGIQAVWATWTIPPAAGETGVWESFDFAQDADDATLWTGILELPDGTDPGDVHFVVQAANGVGRVTIDDNVGALYRPGSIPGVGQEVPGAPDPAATTITFTTAPPASVTFGASFPVAVRLTSEGEPVANKFVRIGLGSTGLPARTDTDGRASVDLLASLTPSTYPVTASFAGDATHASSDATAIVTVTARPTTLTLGGTLAPSTNGVAPAIHAILRATPSTPLHQRNVFVVIRGTGPANLTVRQVFAGKTDPTGRVDVPSSLMSSLPAGNYRIDGFFNGVNLPGILVLVPDDLDYAPSTATATMGLHPRAVDLMAKAVELLQPLAARPGTAGDKAEDALAKVQSAIRKLNRNDRQGAVGDLEGAAGDLQSGVSNRTLTTAQVRPIQDLITAAAWVIALDARQRAIARGGNATKIAQAQSSINSGNSFWASGRFKDAIARYKDAVARADSA